MFTVAEITKQFIVIINKYNYYLLTLTAFYLECPVFDLFLINSYIISVTAAERQRGCQYPRSEKCGWEHHLWTTCLFVNR